MNMETTDEIKQDLMNMSPEKRSLVIMMMLGDMWRKDQERIEKLNKERHEQIVALMDDVFAPLFGENRNHVAAIDMHLRKSNSDDIVKATRSRIRQYFREKEYDKQTQRTLLSTMMSCILELGVNAADPSYKFSKEAVDIHNDVRHFFKCASWPWKSLMTAMTSYSFDTKITGTNKESWLLNDVSERRLQSFKLDWKNA